MLAEDVQPPECPPRPIALRDGFAVAAAEIADAGPYAPMPLTLTARRIDTGDLLPRGTDAVAPLDAIALRGTRAEAVAGVAPGDGVLAAGGDAAWRPRYAEDRRAWLRASRSRRHGCSRYCRSDNPFAPARAYPRHCCENADARCSAGDAYACAGKGGLCRARGKLAGRSLERWSMRRRDRHRRHWQRDVAMTRCKNRARRGYRSRRTALPFVSGRDRGGIGFCPLLAAAGAARSWPARCDARGPRFWSGGGSWRDEAGGSIDGLPDHGVASTQGDIDHRDEPR